MHDSPINWLCPDCGMVHGRRPAGAATWLYGTCDVCGAADLVAAPQDFGKLREPGQTFEQRG